MWTLKVITSLCRWYTEATHSSDPTFPGHDDEAAKVWLHCTVWMWKKHASGWHVVASLLAISRQRRRWRWVCEHGALFSNILRNLSGNPEGPVTVNSIWNFPQRMAGRAERHPVLDTPLLQSARRANHPRWPDFHTGNMVVIPRNLHTDMKAKIHSPCHGIKVCLRWALERLF